MVAIEANPEMVEQLAKRFKREIQQGRYVIVPSAMGQSDQIEFYVNKYSVWSATDPKWAARNEAQGAPWRRSRFLASGSKRYWSAMGAPYT